MQYQPQRIHGAHHMHPKPSIISLTIGVVLGFCVGAVASPLALTWWVMRGTGNV